MAWFQKRHASGPFHRPKCGKLVMASVIMFAALFKPGSSFVHQALSTKAKINVNRFVSPMPMTPMKSSPLNVYSLRGKSATSSLMRGRVRRAVGTTQNNDDDDDHEAGLMTKTTAPPPPRENSATFPADLIIEQTAAEDAKLDAVEEKHDGSAAVTLLSNIGDALARVFDIISTNHAALAATVLLFLAVFLGPLPSLAVGSGGRMGGSFGPSQRSAPSARTYSSPSSSYGRGFSRGYSSGYYSRPSVVVTPSAPIVTTPYYSPFTPFYTPFFSPRPSGVVGVSTGFPSFFGIFGFLAVAFVAMSVFGNTISSVGNSVMDSVDSAVASSALGPGVSVAQITVALDVPDRDDRSSILGALDRLSKTARTDSRVGVQNLTSQVALELLRRKQSIVSSSTTYTHFRDRNKASREYNKLAIKERGKFERETVSKYGGVDYSQGGGGRRSEAVELTQYSPKATMAVVTIIAAIEGDSTKLPMIRSQADVETALSRIASDAKVDDCLQSAEILWTPEDRSETLTMRDVVSDYPSLRTI